MAQARRIKRTPKKPLPRSRKSWDLPWGLILVILLCGIVLGMLLNGARTDNPKFGAGLKQILTANNSHSEQDPEISQLIEQKSSEKDFEFYELLPDIERVMPDDLPEATPTRVPDDVDYFLQAASFRQYADAEKLRARLALKGYKSVTQARDVEGKGTYYRVRLGPYPDKRKAKTAKNKLQRLGVRPFVYSVKK
jgi:cell division protein FtsN